MCVLSNKRNLFGLITKFCLVLGLFLVLSLGFGLFFSLFLDETGTTSDTKKSNNCRWTFKDNQASAGRLLSSWWSVSRLKSVWHCIWANSRRLKSVWHCIWANPRPRVDSWGRGRSVYLYIQSNLRHQRCLFVRSFVRLTTHKKLPVIGPFSWDRRHGSLHFIP